MRYRRRRYGRPRRRVSMRRRRLRPMRIGYRF